MGNYRIGVDLGGTKIEGVLMAPTGEIVRRLRAPTPAAYDEILRAIKAMTDELRQAQAAAGVGVSAPGKTTAAGLTTNSNAAGLNGKPFAADLKRLLACNVRVANDADCLALSEATDGAAQEAEVVFAVILGTGVGGGIAVNKQVSSGKNAIRGEWGHAPLPWPTAAEYPGPPCYCGRRGCIEVFVSGTGLANDYARVTGKTMTAEQIAAAAVSGVADAVAARCCYANRLARGLAMVVNVLDPDAIVLGGGMSNMDFLYDALPPLMGAWVFGGEFTTPVRKAMHGDSSGVRGAAWLAGESYRFRP